MMANRLEGKNLVLGYDHGDPVIDGLSISIPDERITILVGANASGKSTLLRGLSRLLKPRSGTVVLDGEDIHRVPTRQVATIMGLLPQQPVAPGGITVFDLVVRGRHPHQRWYNQWSAVDESIVEDALHRAGIEDFASRPVDELSGGQRQRVWIAMALAQQTDIMLLDEPTTYLDLAHQIEVLDLLVDLNETMGRTIVVVLHELHLAARYAHHLVAMKNGRIVAEGAPDEVITEELLSDVFGLDARVIPDPLTGSPLVVPVPRVGLGGRSSTETV